MIILTKKEAREVLSTSYDIYAEELASLKYYSSDTDLLIDKLEEQTLRLGRDVSDYVEFP